MSDFQTKATLLDSRCFSHVDREAVAKCGKCNRFYCRECITEIDRKLICSSCQKEDHAAPVEKKRRLFEVPFLLFRGMLGFGILWSLFYFMGKLLLLIPADYHNASYLEKLLK
jgi:hypothetical protein